MLFHNHLVDEIRARSSLEPLEVFAEARRLTTWHYQWLILNEFLPLFVGQPMVDSIRRQGRTRGRCRPGNDYDSFLAADPKWRPTVPGRSGPDGFRMIDFLTYAGVDPGSRGQ